MIFHQTLGLKFGAFLQRFAYFRPIEDERVKDIIGLLKDSFNRETMYGH